MHDMLYARSVLMRRIWTLLPYVRIINKDNEGADIMQVDTASMSHAQSPSRQAYTVCQAATTPKIMLV